MPKLKVGRETGRAVKLHYEIFGTGRPVVLIHGWPLSGRSWEPQLPALVEAGYQVITYDRRGFGQSSQPWNGYDYDSLASDLNALIEHLDLTNATVVGYSMGGGEVVRYISTYGTGRIGQAVLASAVPPYLYKSDDNPDGGLDDAAIEQFEQGVLTDRLAFLDDFTSMFFSPGGLTGLVKDLVSEPMRLYARDIAAFASPKGTLDCINSFARTDFRSDLKSMKIPTLIIHGDSDKTVPFEVSGKRSHEAIPGSRLELIAGGPHGANVTHAQEFNSALLSFLGSEMVRGATR